MKILIAPDSFKGTLTALEVADIISRAIGNNAECECLPLSDGGEGFCDSVYRACGGEMKTVLCHDIYYNEIKAPVLFLDKTAVIESAAASGLQAKSVLCSPHLTAPANLLNLPQSRDITILFWAWAARAVPTAVSAH